MPNYTGNDLTADIDAVWEVSCSSFPRMAEAYHSANYAVYRTNEVIPRGDESAFMPKWRLIRDDLTSILGSSSRNIEDTAAALREAMREYAERDDEARAALDQAMQDQPGYVPKLPPTRIPLSYPYAGPYQPVDPGVLDAMYDGGAPTVQQLLDKARTADEKWLEARQKEQETTFLPDSWDDLAPWWLFSGVEFIYILMEEAVRCNPSWYEYGISTLRGVSHHDSDDKPFGLFRTEVNNARDALNPDIWDGDAARNFRRDFLNAYEDIADTQVLVVGTLLGALMGYQKALEDTYRRYDEALDETIESLQAIINGTTRSAIGMATAVLSAAITVVGTMATGGGTTALRFALAGSGVSIASTAFSVGGPNVDTVSENIKEAIGKIKGSLEAFDQALAVALDADARMVDELRSAPGAIILPRPSFADDPALF